MKEAFLNELAGLCGAENLTLGPELQQRVPAWDTRQPYRAAAEVRPASTEEVAAVLAACNAAGQSVVTCGGVTNLVQACATTPDDLVLSLARMNAIEEVDPVAHTLVADAGVTLADAQQAADAAGLLYPVDIGARDNCTLGGNIATNAGGTRVIRYGMSRDCVLGLEAVLADGTVLSSMNRYIKNNSGFDLKQLFIGSEGVLGVVTRVVMRLAEKPASHNVALLACSSYDNVQAVLRQLRSQLGTDLCGFEVMWDSFYSQVTTPVGRQEPLLPAGHACYVLVEAMGSDVSRDDDRFAEVMTATVETDSVVDGVMAKSGQERDAIWKIRHDVEWIVSGAQNFDVSLRVADIGRYVEKLTAAIAANAPQVHVAAFGHLGDNNLHVSAIGACDDDTAAMVTEEVYRNLLPFNGAISAEHGIGLEKRKWLPLSRTAAEISAMRLLKKSLDPKNILNPGKVTGPV